MLRPKRNDPILHLCNLYLSNYNLIEFKGSLITEAIYFSFHENDTLFSRDKELNIV